MYNEELDSRIKHLLDLMGVDINSLSEVKYKELEKMLKDISTQHYMQGYDDGYTLCAGYSRK
jgi:hypothetical protein